MPIYKIPDGLFEGDFFPKLLNGIKTNSSFRGKLRLREHPYVNATAEDFPTISQAEAGSGKFAEPQHWAYIITAVGRRMEQHIFPYCKEMSDDERIAQEWSFSHQQYILTPQRLWYYENGKGKELPIKSDGGLQTFFQMLLTLRYLRKSNPSLDTRQQN